MILYGTNPIAWANDDDTSIGADVPTERILAEAGREIGFDGIENGHRWPDDPVELGELLSSHGLKFVSGWYSTEFLTRSVEDEIEAVEPHLAKLRHNGSAVCVTCETSNAIHGDDSAALVDKPTLDAGAMREFGAKVEAFAEHMAREGVALAYHHHAGTVVETPDEIDAFMAATGPATRLLFDTGHYYVGGRGADPARGLERHLDRVVHFHAKNVREDVLHEVLDGRLSFLEGVRRGVFTVPGDPEGAIDFAPCLALLARAGYGGWLVIEAEQDPAVREPLAYQRLGLETLKRLARETGLDRGERR